MPKKQYFCRLCLETQGSQTQDRPWSKNELAWTVNSRLGNDVRQLLIAKGHQVAAETSRVCGLKFKFVDSGRYDNTMTLANIDGPNGVLADSNVGPTQGGCKQRYDVSDYNRLDLFSIMLHEWGHFLGSFHKGAGVMKPYYAKTDGWQAADVQWLREYYGGPTPTEPPPPPPGNGSDVWIRVKYFGGGAADFNLKDAMSITVDGYDVIPKAA